MTELNPALLQRVRRALARQNKRLKVPRSEREWNEMGMQVIDNHFNTLDCWCLQSNEQLENLLVELKS